MAEFASPRYLTVVPVAVLFCLTVLSCAAAGAADNIAEFFSNIVINKDSKLEVHESIKVEFENPHHGIVRSIPTRATVLGESHAINIRIIRACVAGNELYETTYGPDKVDVKIGYKDRTVVGTYEFVIDYVVEGAMMAPKGNPMLSWNVTGDHWKMPITKVWAIVTPPIGTAVARANTKVFAPAASQPAVKRESGDFVFTALNIQPGNGLVVQTELPSGSVRLPSGTDRMWTGAATEAAKDMDIAGQQTRQALGMLGLAAVVLGGIYVFANGAAYHYRNTGGRHYHNNYYGDNYYGSSSNDSGWFGGGGGSDSSYSSDSGSGSSDGGSFGGGGGDTW